MTVVLHTIAELRSALAGRDVAFVPTMGALHEGHLSLVRIAREHAPDVVVSIFVNPSQFAAGEDFDRYPRTLDEDVALLEREQVGWVFAPDAREMYPVPPHTATATTIHAGPAAQRFEGAARPGHFDGMLTVVAKLLTIVGPSTAVFGEKDAQQLALVRQMVADLNLPVKIVGAPISREADGLARSSRNRYLTPKQRAAAPAISRALALVAEQLGTVSVAAALEAGRAHISAHSELEVEYLELVDGNDFTPIAEPQPNGLLITAVRAGQTRLLDAHTLG